MRSSRSKASGSRMTTRSSRTSASRARPFFMWSRSWRGTRRQATRLIRASKIDSRVRSSQHKMGRTALLAEVLYDDAADAPDLVDVGRQPGTE